MFQGRDVSEELPKKRAEDESGESREDDVANASTDEVCSCKRSLFKRGVKVIKDNEISKLFEKIGFDFLRTIGLDSHDILFFLQNIFHKVR